MQDKLIEALQLKLKREKLARQEAERIMEIKSRELFELNLNLEKRVQKGVEEKNQFAFALTHCENAIAIFDGQKVITWCNQAFEELFQKPKIGTDISDVAKLNLNISSEFTNGVDIATSTNEYQSFEFLIQEGEKTKSLIASVTPSENSTHDMNQFVLVISDTTSLRQAEQKIAQQDRHYRGIFDRMGLGLLQLDNELKVIDANKNLCEQLGQQVINENFWNLFELSDPLKSNRFLSEFTCNDIELRFVNPTNDETTLWFLGSSIPLNDDSETFQVVSLINISDRKTYELRLEEARQKAEASNQAKRRFVANISHEIKTPVNSLSGLIELIDAEELNTKEQSYLSAIKSSAKTLFTLTSDILDIYRIEENKMVPKLNVAEIRKELAHQISFFVAQVDRSKVNFSAVIDDSVPQHLLGDFGRYLQILTNVVGNAIKFTPSGNVELDIRTIPDGEDVLLVTKISDSGVGIPSSLINKVFDEFERGLIEHQTEEGTGLGLAITKKLVDLLGGSIRICSEMGKGTTVEIQIPFQLAPTEGLKTGIGPVDNLDGVRVLVAEDDTFNQLFFQDTLENAKCNVVAVNNGKDAIRALETDHFDVILMDVRMPELDGLDTARHIRSIARIDTPIIGLSANTSDEDQQQCFEAGMNSFLPKPCSPESIVRGVLAANKKKRVPRKGRGGGAPSEKTV